MCVFITTNIHVGTYMLYMYNNSKSTLETKTNLYCSMPQTRNLKCGKFAYYITLHTTNIL